MDDDQEENVTADDILEETRRNDDAENIGRVSGMNDTQTPASPADDSGDEQLAIDDQRTDSNLDSAELYDEGTTATANDFALPNDDDDTSDKDVLQEPGT